MTGLIWPIRLVLYKNVFSSCVKYPIVYVWPEGNFVV